MNMQRVRCVVQSWIVWLVCYVPGVAMVLISSSNLPHRQRSARHRDCWQHLIVGAYESIHTHIHMRIYLVCNCSLFSSYEVRVSARPLVRPVRPGCSTKVKVSVCFDFFHSSSTRFGNISATIVLVCVSQPQQLRHHQ